MYLPDDDVFAVQSFLASRDALRQLQEKVPLQQFFSRKEADVLSRYPSLFYGSTFEQFHRYVGWMIQTTYSNTTGISKSRSPKSRAPSSARSCETISAS